MARANMVLLIAAVACLGCVATLRADDRGATPARIALSMSVSELKVDGIPLGRVLDYLRDSTGCNMVVNWKVLDAANVSKDTPITLNVRDLTMRKLLRLVLDQASPSTELTWTLDSNVISITSVAEADKVMLTRVYVVDDLVMTDNVVSQPPTFNLQAITQTSVTNGGNGGTGGGAGGGGNTGLFQQTTAAAPQQTTAQRGDDLVKLIETVIRPDIWRDNGGTCSIRYFNGKLIVTAPVSVQEMVGGASGALGS